MRAVQVKVTRDTYPIDGSTREEVLRTINERGPRQGADRFVAYTSWQVTWTYAIDKDGRGGVRDPVVNVTAHVTLPEWRGEQRATPAFRRRCRRALSAIREHETEHLAMAIEAGEMAYNVLQATRPATGLTRERVDALVGEAIAVVQEKEKHHDRVTQHGITQGTSI
jgi:predicted secreted Zn-dependent protease